MIYKPRFYDKQLEILYYLALKEYLELTNKVRKYHNSGIIKKIWLRITIQYNPFYEKLIPSWKEHIRDIIKINKEFEKAGIDNYE